MEQSRVKKYQEYRNSLKKIKDENLPSYTNHKISKKSADEVLNEQKEHTSSISTLSISYQQIFDATENREQESVIEKKIRNRYRLKIGLTVAGCLILLAVIVVAAILIFK